MTISQGVSVNSRTCEDDGVGDLHNCGGLHASNEPSEADDEARSMPNTGVVEHLKEPTSIKPKVLLSCKECTYKTNYLPRRMARSNDRRKNPPRDPNNNLEKTLTDVIAREAVQRNHEGKAPDPAENDDLEYLPDTNSTDDSKSGSCMEVHGDEE